MGMLCLYLAVNSGKFTELDKAYDLIEFTAWLIDQYLYHNSLKSVVAKTKSV
jgi:hypothetical protein